MKRARGTPIFVDQSGQKVLLERIRLGSGTHSEHWLQELIHSQPSILPIADIEPAFGEPIPIAREVPCGVGFIDNLYLTPSGDIVLVETKLWRNSEIRREVVAQALDYVAALTAMTYVKFEQAVSKGMGAPSHLYDPFAENPEALEEPDFIDAVSRNLSTGRILVIVLGDGIRTETEALAGLLQSHAGAHFTFALIELATWRSPKGEILAVPDVLARTMMIERGVVRFEGQGFTITPPAPETKVRPQSISMSDFMVTMASRNPELPEAIAALLEALEPFGVYPELGSSLSLKIDMPELPKPANFGYIDRSGKFWTNPASLNLPDKTWRAYFDKVADLIGGVVIDEPNNRFVAIRERSAPRIDELIPDHLDEFVKTIGAAVQSLREEG